MRILVTGGAGFIGGNFCRMYAGKHQIISYDKLTYAANPAFIPATNTDDYTFIKGDICDKSKLTQVFDEFLPDCVVNFAAESHVDRSIDGPMTFVHTNVVGTCQLLEVARAYKRDGFRLLHISTDEVYGSLEIGKFTEETRYSPNSPYSASKASSDHFVRAYHATYGLPTIITNCSNNYGPYQFPEKLIPLMILNAFDGKELPVYGDGQQIRDWIFVEDHCRAVELILRDGTIGSVYNIGGDCEMANLDVVKLIQSKIGGIIKFVVDRPGHDRRYAIDCTKLKNELSWSPIETFESGLDRTIEWYRCNRAVVENNTTYRRQRLGIN